jgi:SP family facilitated glucose transporter-like MFS transporter 8
MIQSTDRVDNPEDIPLYPTSGASNRRSFGSCLCGGRDVLAAVIACLGAMSMGFALGYSSPALRDLPLIKILVTDENKSWFGSLVTLGAMIGGPIGAVCIERFGRKTSLMLCNMPLAIGWFLIIYASEYVILFCGR